MTTTASEHAESGPSLRPRIIDVSAMEYAEAVSRVDGETTAYFERRPGRTHLVVR
jgi:hypothetical protein